MLSMLPTCKSRPVETVRQHKACGASAELVPVSVDPVTNTCGELDNQFNVANAVETLVALGPEVVSDSLKAS